MTREKTTSPRTFLNNNGNTRVHPVTCLICAFFMISSTIGVEAYAVEAEQILLIPRQGIGMGDVRSETIASAARLVGLKNSFTHDSFIAHILYVNGISEKDALPQKAWAGELARKLKKLGLLENRSEPRPGDLVFFSLQSGLPHSSRAQKQTVGVVESVANGKVTFITAGTDKIYRGTLALDNKKVRETRLISCKPEEKQEKARKSGKKSSKAEKKPKKGSTGSKTAKKAKPEKINCKASDLLIGFADIDLVANKLAKPPAVAPKIVIADEPAQKLQDVDKTPGQLRKEN